MAFCKYCGKELKDGEICDCRQSVQQNAAKPQSDGCDFVNNNYQPAQSQANTFVQAKINHYHSFVDFIKLYFRNPDRAARFSAEKKIS